MNKERYTKIVVVLQKSEKDNSCTQNNIVFDHMNADRIEVRVNGYKYPQGDFKWDSSLPMKIILMLIDVFYSLI